MDFWKNSDEFLQLGKAYFFMPVLYPKPTQKRKKLCAFQLPKEEKPGKLRRRGS